MKTTTSARLKEVMQLYNLRQIDILKKAEPYCKNLGIKMGRNDLSQYVSGKVLPGQEKLTALSQALNVSETWLMGYDVPMTQPSLQFDSAPDDTPWNRALSKLQSGTTLSQEEVAALNKGLPKAIKDCEEAFSNFSDNVISFHLKKSFSQLSDINKKKVVDYSDNLLKIQQMEEEQLHLIPDAAHDRTDISDSDRTEASRKEEDDIMDDPNF
ncbi:hypothetical protein DXA97_11765 [Clostridium sp. OF09-36]|uniref:hypothetical protein n=1 Tax=Clostridium sp. OF09-36 TaxID=2292310 RepID=UPI000E4BA1FC|nr:hypothetical protein [Clostridium sp. OF09-36]RHV86921.1 hypothetical protein DXA97_11765 [Clostridium sp. OF09-36]